MIKQNSSQQLQLQQGMTNLLVDLSCFDSINELVRNYRLEEETLRNLELNEKKYYRIFSIRDNNDREEEAIRRLAQDNLRLETEVHQNHVRALKIAELLFSEKFNLNGLKCDGEDMEEIEKVAQQCKEACKYDMSAFWFFSAYLQICVQNLSKEGKCVMVIEERLVEVLNRLKKLHPPNDNRPSGTQIHQIRSVKSIQKGANKIALAFVKKIGQKIKQNYGQKGISPQVVEARLTKARNQLLQQLQILEDSSSNKENIKQPSRNLGKIELKSVKQKEKNSKLNNFIVEVANIAKQNLSNLIELTKDACLNNNGRQFKAGVKVSNPQSTSALDRVKEKLLSKNFEKMKITGEQISLSGFLRKQKETYHEQLETIFERTEEAIEFTVSDMLRGKCMFKEVSEINEAALTIIKECKERGYRIIEIDNRLSSKTTDLVFKIEIDGVVSEFQLAYMFDVVDNEFNHKIYELLRSNFFSTISTLHLFNEKGKIQLHEFCQILGACCHMKHDIREYVSGQQYTLRKQLKKQTEKWLKKCRISTIETRLTLQELESKERMFSHLNNTSNNKRKENWVQKRQRFEYLTILYLTEAAKYQLAEDRIIKCNKEAEENYQSEQQKDLLLESKMLQIHCKIVKDQGRNLEALQLSQKYLLLLDRTKGKTSIPYVECLESIGLMYTNKGDYKEALDVFEKCLSIKEKLKGVGVNSIEYTLTNKNIAKVYELQQNLYKSLEIYDSCLQIQKKVLGVESLHYAETLSHMGTIYRMVGKYPQAFENYKKSLEIRQLIKGRDSLDCSDILNNIGLIYKEMGDGMKALKSYTESLEIRQKIRGRFSLQYAETLNNIAVVYSEYQKDGIKALECYKQSLDIRQKIKGKYSLDGSDTHNSIGLLYMGKKDYFLALKSFKESLNIRQTLKGECSMGCAWVLVNMGLVHKEMSEYYDAIEYFMQSLEIKKQLRGKCSIEVASTIKLLGDVYVEQRNLPKALQMFTQSLEIRQSIKGRISGECVELLNCLGVVYREKRSHQKALQCHFEALEILQKLKGNNYNQIRGLTYLQLGNVQQDLQEFKKALQAYTSALDIFDSKPQVSGQNSEQKDLIDAIDRCRKRVSNE